MLVDPDGHWVWLAANAGFAAYDGYKAYKAGKGWKGVAWAAASNFGPGKAFKGAKRTVEFTKKAVKKSRNKPGGPNPKAVGAHTKFKVKKGRIVEYTTFDKKGRWRKQFRGEGKPHGSISRPNIKEIRWNVNKKTNIRYPKPHVRKPYKRERPRGY